MANEYQKHDSVNVWLVPQVRSIRFESYIESYANKPDRAKMGCYPNIYYFSENFFVLSLGNLVGMPLHYRILFSLQPVKQYQSIRGERLASA